MAALRVAAGAAPGASRPRATVVSLAMSWMDARAVAFDVETTGTDPTQARIVTAALVWFEGGAPAQTWTALADPGVEIPAGAAAVHGITTEYARAHGRPAREVVLELLEQLAARTPQTPIIIMNARYDLTVLATEAERHGLRELLPDWFPGAVIDPLVIDRHVDRFRKGPRNLTSLCAHYGVVLEDAHSADADALAAAAVAYKLCRESRVVRNVRDAVEERELETLQAEWDAVRLDAAALVEAQVRWHRLWADDFAEFLRRKGNDVNAAALESEVWPLTVATVR